MAEELQLVISNPGEDKFLKHIDWNKEEFMEIVASIMARYKGLTYTDEQIKEAKTDRANLNAMKKAISDRRIQVKKVVMEPYTQFEKEVAEVVALIEEPILMIDTQIKEYEERLKMEKREALKEYFEEIAADLEGILTFDRIFDQRYLNATVSLNKAKADIKDKVDRVNVDLNTLNSLEAEYRVFARDTYVRTLDMSKTMAEVSRLQELKRQEDERIRKQKEAEEARLRAEAEAEATKTEKAAVEEPKEMAVPEQKSVENVTAEAEVIPPAPVGIDVPDETAMAKTEEDTKQYKASFTVYGTKAQIMALKEYMVQQNIKFGKVEK